jgi:hypothetical protein
LEVAAVDALANDDPGNLGKMVGPCGNEICRVPLDEVSGEQCPLARIFTGWPGYSPRYPINAVCE